MSRVTIKTGFVDSEGREEELSEFICDYPNCPNIATQVLGRVIALRAMTVVCEAHAPQARV